jgi:pyroglutamyl-peptidase
MPLTVLVTGFGPFPGAPFNPTGALVRALVKLRRPALANVRLVPHVFETSYRAVDRDLPHLLKTVKPDAVLMFGLSGKASSLKVETRARNVGSALIGDVDGQILSTGIVAGGQMALPFNVPAARLATVARKARTAAVTSRDAGRYLCNYLSWRAIEATSNPQGPVFAAFIHVPPVAEAVRPRRAAKTRVWRMADLLRGGEAILAAAVAETRRRRHMTKG